VRAAKPEQMAPLVEETASLNNRMILFQLDNDDSLQLKR